MRRWSAASTYRRSESVDTGESDAGDQQQADAGGDEARGAPLLVVAADTREHPPEGGFDSGRYEHGGRADDNAERPDSQRDERNGRHAEELAGHREKSPVDSRGGDAPRFRSRNATSASERSRSR